MMAPKVGMAVAEDALIQGANANRRSRVANDDLALSFLILVLFVSEGITWVGRNVHTPSNVATYNHSPARPWIGVQIVIDWTIFGICLFMRFKFEWTCDKLIGHVLSFGWLVALLVGDIIIARWSPWAVLQLVLDAGYYANILFFTALAAGSTKSNTQAPFKASPILLKLFVCLFSTMIFATDIANTAEFFPSDWSDINRLAIECVLVFSCIHLVFDDVRWEGYICNCEKGWSWSKLNAPETLLLAIGVTFYISEMTIWNVRNSRYDSEAMSALQGVVNLVAIFLVLVLSFVKQGEIFHAEPGGIATLFAFVPYIVLVALDVVRVVVKQNVALETNADDQTLSVWQIVIDTCGYGVILFMSSIVPKVEFRTVIRWCNFIFVIMIIVVSCLKYAANNKPPLAFISACVECTLCAQLLHLSLSTKAQSPEDESDPSFFMGQDTVDNP